MAASIKEMNVKSADVAGNGAILVMGMGVTGASCARYFAACGTRAEFVDTRPSPPCVDEILDALPDARVYAGEQPISLPPDIDKVVVSPGVDLDSSLLQQARENGIGIYSDIDIFVSECAAPIIAVTGSNGKSTVTSMVGDMLSTVGLATAIGGNLGTPALDLLSSEIEVYILELSSFQLERSALVPAAASVILNLSPDHLDQHGNMQNYTDAKARIYGATRHAVVNRDFPALNGLVPAGTQRSSFGISEPKPDQIGIRSTPRGECIVRGGEILMSVDDLNLVGRHNVSNAMAALALGGALGISPPSLAQALKQYRGLPHRMQVVVEHNSITWIDDSKATNVGAALASIGGVSDPFVLIAGGDAKGAEFDLLAAALAGRQCSVILIGKDAVRMSHVLADTCSTEIVDDISAAVVAANAIATPGYTVLLAPACSSLDMFRNFADRGDQFAAAAREVIE
jgi:UDP-N-acetylmuramoylalanine--D-glutamate ligase